MKIKREKLSLADCYRRLARLYTWRSYNNYNRLLEIAESLDIQNQPK